MSCENCLNRRDFLARSALAAAALVAAEACGDGQIGPSAPHITGGGDPNLPVGGPIVVKLASVPALATVGTLVDIGSERALIRTGPTTFLGLSKVCTHEQCETEVRNNRLECPCHGSIFSNNGTPIREPDIAAPPNTPLRALQATFDPVANTVTVA